VEFLPDSGHAVPVRRDNEQTTSPDECPRSAEGKDHNGGGIYSL
jgi:hypothetical protein